MKTETNEKPSGSDKVQALVLSDYFKWGARNHPGNPFYVVLVLAFSVAAFKNAINLKSGLIAATIANALLAVLYVCTSVSVGKANKRLIEKERQNDRCDSTPGKTNG